MRIGVRVTEEALFGVVVDEGRIRGSITEKILAGGDLGSAFEKMLLTLIETVGIQSQTLSITFEVSRVLVPSELESVTAVRIAPRPPMDAAHLYSGETTARHTERVQHLTGGFTKEGDELVPLDAEGLHKIAREAPPGRRYVLTGVGASFNPSHEIEASRILFAEAKPASVTHSHSFHNSSFAVRERTAVINSSLLSDGQQIVTALASVVAKHTSQSRLLVMTNDGGAAPLSALAVKPVHSMLSERAAVLVGAAALAGVDNGWIVIQSPRGEVLGEMTGGTPTVTSRTQLPSAEAIATRSAQLVPNSDGLIGDWMGTPVVVASVDSAVGIDQRENAASERLAASRHVRSDVDLAGLGAACAPLIEWVEQDVKISSEAEKEQVISMHEAKVRMRLVANGVPPAQVRILESRIIGASYENSSTVVIRVRGIGGQSPRELLSRITE